MFALSNWSTFFTQHLLIKSSTNQAISLKTKPRFLFVWYLVFNTVDKIKTIQSGLAKSSTKKLEVYELPPEEIQLTDSNLSVAVENTPKICVESNTDRQNKIDPTDIKIEIKTVNRKTFKSIYTLKKNITIKIKDSAKEGFSAHSTGLKSKSKEKHFRKSRTKK